MFCKPQNKQTNIYRSLTGLDVIIFTTDLISALDNEKRLTFDTILLFNEEIFHDEFRLDV